jgi:amino acid transporter
MSAGGGAAAGTLGLRSGIGLVAANMIGAGVFLSAGFMAQEMSAGWILLDWVAGMLLAMAGARAYGEVARLVPRSGGEYRYLSELIHPSLRRASSARWCRSSTRAWWRPCSCSC